MDKYLQEITNLSNYQIINLSIATICAIGAVYFHRLNDKIQKNQRNPLSKLETPEI